MDYDGAVASLDTGLSSFKASRNMTQGQATAVGLAISLSPSDWQGVQSSLRNVGGDAITSAVKVARYMSAQLSGPAFRVEPAGPIRKQLGGFGPTVWEWKVTPTEPGQRELRLETSVHFSLPGDREDQEPLPVQSQLIDVAVAPPSRASAVTLPGVTRTVKNIGDLLTSMGGLVAAAIALMVALGWRKSRQSAGAT